MLFFVYYRLITKRSAMSSAFYDIQYKASAGQVNLDQAQGIVECFVAGIGNKDSVGDVCATGAFTKSLMRRKPRVVWGHNWNDPIGKVLEIYEVPTNDPRLPAKMKAAGIGGLYAKVQFNLNSEKGREAFANVAFFGEEQEWSIGYKTLRAQFDPGIQANILYEVELYEVSPVLHGANQLTGTISVKSDEKGGMMPMMAPPMEKPTDDETEMQEEMERKLQEELSARLGSPVKVLKMNDGVVYFSRENGEGGSSYKCRYHMGNDGVFMFGRPERFQMPQAMPQAMPAAKPVPRMPMGMPSRPMAPTPGAPPVVVPALVPGATPASPPMVRFNFEEDEQSPAAEKPKLVAEERDLAEALVKITKRYGKFNEDSTGVWAGYKPAAENPVAKIGVKCANCVMFEGEGKCKIIDKQVEPEGKCRFAIIPEGVVSMGPVQKANYDIEAQEEEVKWLEDIEAKYPGEFVSGVLRGAVKRRRKRRMMNKKVFRIDEYQEKSLEDFLDADFLDISYVLPVSAENAFNVKQLIDPIIDYHMVDAVVVEDGIVFSGGVTKDFVEAVGAAVSAPFFQTEQKALGRNLAGRITRTTRGLTARFDPNAWDGDNDGVVQEGTPFERPAIPGVNDFASGGKVNKRKARQAWRDYKKQGKPAAQKKPETQQPVVDSGREKITGLSSGMSGEKLRPAKPSNNASRALEQSIGKQDYNWGIDDIVDDFEREYLDGIDMLDLEDAHNELVAQFKMNKMKALKDGVLNDDVLGDDFDATAKRIAKELNLDEVDADKEAGRVFDARDAYLTRAEQYKQAVRAIKRRIRNRDRDLDIAEEADRRGELPQPAATRRDSRRGRINRGRPQEGILDNRTKAGRAQEIKDRTNTGIEKFDIDKGLSSGSSDYPSYDASDEEWNAYFERAQQEREARGPRPYGDELPSGGFKEDLSDGPASGTSRIFRTDVGWDGQAVIHHQDEELTGVNWTVLDPENMPEDLGAAWYMGDMSGGKKNPLKVRPGWYVDRMVFDDYEGYYTDEADYDFGYSIGPFNSPEDAAKYWADKGVNLDSDNRKRAINDAGETSPKFEVGEDGLWRKVDEDERGLSSGARVERKYPPRYESSKKLADLMESSSKPNRSDYDYSQDSDRIPTDEQKDIIDAVLEGSDVVVGALAGSGKTSTLVSIARRLRREDPNKKVVYLAFNKSAAQDAKRRFKGTGVVVMTMDALSYNWYVGQGNDQKQHVAKRFSLDKAKATGTPTTRKDIARKFTVKPYRFTDSDGTEKELSSEDIAKMAIDAVGQFEISSDTEVGPQHFGKRKGSIFEEMPSSEIPPGAVDLAKKIWASKIDTKDPEGVQISNSTITKLMALDMPSISNGEATGRKVDLVMIDEAQDLNPVFTDFAIGQKGLQKVTVGDPNQAIYGFRGARNEMDRMGAEADYVLPLTEVFRFGPELAGPGNRVLSLFNIMRGRMVGRGGSGEVIDPPGSMEKPDMILARTNAGVIKESMASLDAGRTVATTKRAYDELESFIESWKYLIGASKTPPANMHADLKEYDSYKDLKKDIDQGTASQKAKTLFNIGMDNKVEDLEKLLGSIFIWNPDDEGGESTLIEEPEDFEVGTLGIIGPATYEILDDEIVLYDTFEIKDWIKASGGWTFDFKNTKTWRKKASTPEERENALVSLTDALNNGTSGSDVDGAKIPSSLKNGDSGKFGSIQWEVRSGEIILTGRTYPVKDRLNSVGWKLRKSSKKDPKTGKPIWETYYKLSGDQQEDLDMMEILAGIATGGAPMPSYASTIVKATDDEILEKARKIADKPTTEERDRDIIKNILASYERNGWLRRRAWETLEGKTKTKRETPPIDVRVLTAHLAKGLEADNVKLANDFWGPRQKMETVPGTGDKVPSGEVEWPDEEHMKVMYVALTRAKKTLDPGSASWIYGYTDEDDDLPEDPDPDRYVLDGEEGLSSGGRGKRKRIRQQPWSDEDRQRFADGNRLRAQTRPGRRREGPTADEFRGLSSGEAADEFEGLSSGANQSAAQKLEKDIYDARMGGMTLDQAATEFGMSRQEVRQAELRHIRRQRDRGLVAAGFPNSDVEREIYEARMGGMSLDKAAEQFNMTRAAIRQAEIRHMHRERTEIPYPGPASDGLSSGATSFRGYGGAGLSSGGVDLADVSDPLRDVSKEDSSSASEALNAKYDLKKRSELLRDGNAITSNDGDIVFPIVNAEDLANAIVGFRSAPSSMRPELKDLIRRRASELGREDLLPDTFQSGKNVIRASRKNADGTETTFNPVDVETFSKAAEAKQKLDAALRGEIDLSPEEKRQLRSAARMGSHAEMVIDPAITKAVKKASYSASLKASSGFDREEAEQIARIAIMQALINGGYDSSRGTFDDFMMSQANGAISRYRKKEKSQGAQGFGVGSIDAPRGGSEDDDQDKRAELAAADEANPDIDDESDDAISISAGRIASAGSSDVDVYGRGFGYEAPNREHLAEYEKEIKARYKQEVTDKIKNFTSRPSIEQWKKDNGIPSYEEWAASKGYEPNAVYVQTFKAPQNKKGIRYNLIRTSDDGQKRISKAWKSARFGSLSSNPENRNSGDDDLWMLPTSQLRKLFVTNENRQMTDAEIASVLGIQTSDVASWDDPNRGISLSSVRALLQARDSNNIPKELLGNGDDPISGSLIDSEIQGTWGFGSFPFMQARDGSMIETQEQYDFYDAEQRDKRRREITGFSSDPRLDRIPVSSKKQDGRGNFPPMVIARKLGWVGKNSDYDDPKTKEQVMQRLGEIINAGPDALKKYYEEGLPVELVSSLVDSGIISSPLDAVSPTALVDNPDLGRIMSPNQAQDAVVRYLESLGLDEDAIRPIFNNTFSPPGKNFKNLHDRYKARIEKKQSGGKIDPPKGGGSEATRRISVTQEEVDTFVQQLNDSLQKRAAKNPALAGKKVEASLFENPRPSNSESEGLSSGAKPSARDVENFVKMATQNGKMSGAATQEEILGRDAGQSQVSKLKNALRARETLADQFPEISDNPGMTIRDFDKTGIDNPEKAMEAAQRLDAYIQSIIDQAYDLQAQSMRENAARQYEEEKRNRITEMLDLLEGDDIEVERSLRSTLDTLNEKIKASLVKEEQEYSPIVSRVREMEQLLDIARGFSRNNGRNQPQRTKGARAASNKRLISL